MIIVAAVALLATGVIFYIISTGGKIDPESNLLVSPTPTPSADAFVGWQTYTNTAYGFEFKYPNGLSSQESKNTATGLMEQVNVYLTQDYAYDFEVSVWSKNTSSVCLSNDFEKINIDSQEGTRRHGLSVYYEDIIEICANDYAYKLTFTNWKISGCSSEDRNCSKNLNNLSEQEKEIIAEYERIENQILSTFKFIP